MNENRKKIMNHWYAWIYEQEEDAAEMAEYIVNQLGDRPLRVLEAACGGGKLCVPLAQAGHDVTGIEKDAYMLEHLERKAGSMENLCVQRMDLLSKPWGTGFDAVILGANLMLNIVSDRDYKRAQKNLLERAFDALRIGGRLLIDYDCPLSLAGWEPANTEWVCFEGTDDAGTFGRYIVVSGTANDRTRIVTGSRRWEMKTAEGEAFVHTAESYKYFPALEQVCAWLYRIGFTIESVNGGYHGEAFDAEHRRAVIWARKSAL